MNQCLYSPLTATLYIQMELCEATLRQWLDCRNSSPSPSLQPRDNFTIFRQLLLATDFLHSQGVIHRDIKPRNVFVSSGLAVKLGDFGLAKDLLVSPSSPNTPAEELLQGSLHPLGRGQAPRGDTRFVYVNLNSNKYIYYQRGGHHSLRCPRAAGQGGPGGLYD